MIYLFKGFPIKINVILFYVSKNWLSIYIDLIVDGDLLEDVTIDEVKDELPEHQPRFLLYSFPLVHSDSRISYPLCLIFSSPRESKTELMVMYAGSKNELERISNVNKCYELTELDDLTLDWLKAKLAK